MATNPAPANTTVTSLADLSKKTNTDVMVGIRRKTKEYGWFDDTPDEKITPSGNEMRLVLDIAYQTGGAMIPDGGYEDQATTVAPQHGTFTFVQMNKRYSFTTLAKGYDAKGRAGYIQRQIQYQSIKAVEAIARKVGLQTYGFSTGTVAVVNATNGAGAAQIDIQLKNTFGTTLLPGTSAAGKVYNTNLFRVGEPVALVRGSTVQDFGVVVASPAASGLAGAIDITFNGSVTPTANDLIVFASAVTDTALTGTDTNRWPVGMLDMMTSASVHGLATSAAAEWQAAYANTAGGRMSYQVQEAMVNAVDNFSGSDMNRVIYSQGVRRDMIAGERAALRYDSSSSMDWNGEVGTKGIKYFTSVLAPTGMFMGWNNDAIGKKVLSDKPDYEGGPDIFSLDKVQDKGAVAASFDFIYARICNARRGLAYAANLTES
jgi:hypothetical protein